MDDIVRQAMAKWPNVPHCHGWLALDARGQWRMRDQRCQALNLPGDIIHHKALLAFIGRNYQSNDKGEWYFQNGPQRVYVDLAACPFVLRLDPQRGLLDHCDQAWPAPEAIWADRDGQFILCQAEKVAQVDDRDLSAFLPYFRHQGQEVSDTQWEAWLTGEDLTLDWCWPGLPPLRLQRLTESDPALRFGFKRQPRPQ